MTFEAGQIVQRRGTRVRYSIVRVSDLRPVVLQVERLCAEPGSDATGWEIADDFEAVPL